MPTEDDGPGDGGRLRVAREELARAGHYDVTVVNDDVGRACDRLLTLLFGG